MRAAEPRERDHRVGGQLAGVREQHAAGDLPGRGRHATLHAPLGQDGRDGDRGPLPERGQRRGSGVTSVIRAAPRTARAAWSASS